MWKTRVNNRILTVCFSTHKTAGTWSPLQVLQPNYINTILYNLHYCRQNRRLTIFVSVFSISNVFMRYSASQTNKIDSDFKTCLFFNTYRCTIIVTEKKTRDNGRFTHGPLCSSKHGAEVRAKKHSNFCFYKRTKQKQYTEFKAYFYHWVFSAAHHPVEI